MKKLAVLSIVLLTLASLIFAEVKVEPTVAFSGSGTLTWGIDLDDATMHGFLNEASANLTVTLVAESTETKGSDADGMVYGWIELSAMSLILNTDNNKDLPADMALAAAIAMVDPDGDLTTTDDRFVYAPDGDTISVPTAFLVKPTVAAKVVLGPAKWIIFDAPDLAVTYAVALEDESADDDVNNWAEDEETDDVAPDFDGYGTGIEFATGPISLTAKVVSASDWTAAASYAAGLSATLAAGPATVDLGVNYPFDAGPFGFGVKAVVAAGPATITAAFDGTADGGFAYEVAGGVSLALPALVTLTADAAYSEAWSLDAEVGATLAAEMVPGLAFSTLVGLWDIIVTDGLEWGVKVDASYKVMMGETNYVKPGVTAYVSTEVGADLRVALTGTVEAVLIPNTVFTLTYDDAYLTGPAASADRSLTFATKVSY